MSARLLSVQPLAIPAGRPPGTDDERVLVAALPRGEKGAFVELVARHGPSLLRLARTFVRDRAVAEEVVQETWLAVLDGIDRFEGRSSLKTVARSDDGARLAPAEGPAGLLALVQLRQRRQSRTPCSPPTTGSTTTTARRRRASRPSSAPPIPPIRPSMPRWPAPPRSRAARSSGVCAGAARAGGWRWRSAFYSVERQGRGRALLYRLADGRGALRLENFRTSTNTDLFVWLSTARRPRTTKQVTRARRIGDLRPLKSTEGAQNYLLPAGLDLSRIRSVAIWCVPIQIVYTAAAY